ncbi:glycosyltransferase family 2 protein [Rugosimonospora africana]|uniref:Glycosyl transferase n=1 Tax=Rugosimonospora africana TaxID=556532 RepID=A0A8J3QZ97_9ACTN|nr:glycosyltransferase family 2 protein [Rugosimonospora africana]GIH19638.1 glycosyl transferase [Rugosimonospora africana]
MNDGVSVVVPTYEAWPVLHRTLAAVVADCDLLDVPYEVLAVDNESGPEFREQAGRFAQRHPQVRFIWREGLRGRHFQPGASRNIGIDQARYPCLVFLDADCIPGPDLIRAYRQATRADATTVFVGHRVFVAPSHVDPERIAADRRVLEALEPVASISNYGKTVERRLPELAALAGHPRPYDVMYACDMAMHRDCVGTLRFAPVFDGSWGYEDIELGYRLHRAGRRFAYLPEAYVYHQENGSLSAEERANGRRRNFAIAEDLIDDFAAYRRGIDRVGAVPTAE